MKIARQGRRFVLGGLFVACAGLLPLAWCMPSRLAHRASGVCGSSWAAGLCALVADAGLIFAAFCIYFFRDPDRPPPSDPDKIYATGDGRVLSVAKEGPGDVTTVRIFLSIFDVHVQRHAVSGKVDRVHYQPGAFKAAMDEDAKLNERNVVTIIPDGGRPSVVEEQIAGLIARRIECWVKPGDAARAGERYGIIYFGSQAAIHLPAGARATVRPGDRVAGGVTVIGEWTKAS